MVGGKCVRIFRANTANIFMKKQTLERDVSITTDIAEGKLILIKHELTSCIIKLP